MIVAPEPIPAHGSKPTSFEPGGADGAINSHKFRA